jgi:hypothetical protein
MYSKIVQEEDNKSAENHQKSADGILIFVSPALLAHFSVPQLNTDWFILCHRRCIACSLNPRPEEARLPGNLGILSSEHLSGHVQRNCTYPVRFG